MSTTDRVIELHQVVELLSSGSATADQFVQLAIASVEQKSFSLFETIVSSGFVDVHNAQLLKQALGAYDKRFLVALLDAGVSADHVLPCGDSLLYALERLNTDWPSRRHVNNVLLDRGANPNARNNKKHGHRPLHCLCATVWFDSFGSEKVELLKDFVNAGADINAANDDGRTPLFFAVQNDRSSTEEIVRGLVNLGADVNAIDCKGVSVLECALHKLKVHTGAVKLLLDNRVDARRPLSSGLSPFHFAAASLDAVRLLPLLIGFADINAVDRDGNTPLHVVLNRRELDSDDANSLVQMLIDAGAKCDIANARGESPLACWLSMKVPVPVWDSIIRLLLDAAAPVETKSSQLGRTSCHRAAEFNKDAFVDELINKRGADMNAIGGAGETPLIVAAEHNATNVVPILIAAGAWLDVARSTDGSTALHLAAIRANGKIADALIRAGASVNVVDVRGWTPCHFAILQNDHALVRTLIDAGANANAMCATGESLIYVAALMTKDDSIIRMLVAAGADVNAANSRGQTPCHAAARNAIALRALIDSGAAFDQADADGLTPLAKAVSVGSVDCAGVLVAAGTNNVTHISKTLNTLLHAYVLGAKTVDVSFVGRLVAWGVDVNARNANGLTASSIVAKTGNRQCLITLLAIGADPRAVTVETISDRATLELLVAAGVADTGNPDSYARSLYVAAETLPSDSDAKDTKSARAKLALARWQLVRARGAEVCIGLQSLRLDALQLCEIMLCGCAPAAEHVPFHLLWNVAVKVKHFRAAS